MINHFEIFKMLFDKSEIGVCVTNSKFDYPENPKIIYINPYFEKLTGYSLEEVMWKTPRILQGEETKQYNKLLIKRCLETKTPYNGSVINYTKNKEEYYAKLNINYVKIDGEEYFIGFQYKIRSFRLSTRVRNILQFNI